MLRIRIPARGCVIAILLLSTAHRLPAPIIEDEPSPSAKPKAEHERTARPSERSATSAKSEPRRPAGVDVPKRTPFEGTWTGTIDLGVYGHVLFTFAIDAPGQFVNESSSKFGNHRCPIERAGPSLKWKSGAWFQAGYRTFTPNPDGKTATVIFNNGSQDRSVIFSRL